MLTNFNEQHCLNLDCVDPSWREIITESLSQIEPHYLQLLSRSEDWLPGKQHIFNAFSLPVSEVKYVLFGESPYPRPQSAIGYAFWDAAVKQLWSSTGLSKEVNRATSLRNFIKMLFIAEGLLSKDKTTQSDIANIDKKHLIQTNAELFQNLLNHGFLLLNASLVLQATAVRKDARVWKPFLKNIIAFLLEKNPNLEFLLLGNIANEIEPLITKPVKKIYAEHPYNISFITNQTMIDFFKPLHLLIPS